MLKKVFIILSIIILGTALFYWYEWRPTQIRSSCNTAALPAMQDSWAKTKPNLLTEDNIGRGERIRLQYSAYNQAYDECLHSKGIKE